MIPVALNSIVSGVAGASTPVAGASSLPVNQTEFASKLGTLGAEYGGTSIPLNGGITNTTTASPVTSSLAANTINEPTDFGHLVQQAIYGVNEKQQTAAHMVRDVLAGGSTPVHQALIASEEASVSFQMLTEMRNKVVEAYQEVMRMTV